MAAFGLGFLREVARRRRPRPAPSPPSFSSPGSGTKFAVRAISEGLRQEAGDRLRVTIISPGFVHTNLADSMTSPEVKAQIVNRWKRWRFLRMRLLAPLCSQSISLPISMWAKLSFARQRRANSTVWRRPPYSFGKAARGDPAVSEPWLVKLAPPAPTALPGIAQTSSGIANFSCRSTASGAAVGIVSSAFRDR
jgi:hypothetical protein